MKLGFVSVMIILCWLFLCDYFEFIFRHCLGLRGGVQTVNFQCGSGQARFLNIKDGFFLKTRLSAFH